MLRVSLVHDNPEWILGTISRKMCCYLDSSASLNVRRFDEPQSFPSLVEIQDGADLIHFLSPWMFFNWSKYIYKPCVVSVHHLGTNAKALSREELHKAQALIVPNREMEVSLKAMELVDRECIYRIPYGVDTEHFTFKGDGRRQLLDRLAVGENAILLGLSAKISSNEDERKGFDRYWELLRRVKGISGRPVYLAVFGPNAGLAGGWTSDVVPEDVREQVRFVGFTDHESLPLYYSGLDFYVCLSRLEGGPYPVLECMSCGVPAISTMVGLVPQVLRDEVSGFAVDGDNYLDRIPEIVDNGIKDEAWLKSVGERGREEILTQLAERDIFKESTFLPVYQAAVRRAGAKIPALLRYKSSVARLSAKKFLSGGR